jgi:glycosyltransferase involved in cell wall biosynthesis
MTIASEVTFVLPDKLGGVFNFAANLLEHRRDDGMGYAAVLTDNVITADARSRDPLPADRVERVVFSLPPDNLYAVLRRLSLAIRPGPGVLVANDWIELACATAYDTGRAVIAVAHGDSDFYYDLAVKNEPAVDAWIAISERIRERLSAVIPHRSDEIFLMPFGVPVPASVRTPAPGRLRAVYVGRLSRDKGILDLPAIDRALRDLKVDVAWTILGTGPDEEELRARWEDRSDIAWSGHQPRGRVFAEYLKQDVFVMPSRSEGLPVALLEAGAAGVVPVVSNLPSGVPEVVQPGVTGFRPEGGDIAGFAEAIARLDGDRLFLESLSRAVRARVSERFNAVTRTAEYQRLFARWPELRRSRDHRLVLPYGSRLDRRWIPNPVVRAIRSTLKKP